jgi:hypothetical protein
MRACPQAPQFAARKLCADFCFSQNFQAHIDRGILPFSFLRAGIARKVDAALMKMIEFEKSQDDGDGKKADGRREHG